MWWVSESKNEDRNGSFGKEGEPRKFVVSTGLCCSLSGYVITCMNSFIMYCCSAVGVVVVAVALAVVFVEDAIRMESLSCLFESMAFMALIRTRRRKLLLSF